MNLPEYATNDEKSSFFKIEIIDTLPKLRKFLADHKTKKGIYRGVNSSGFKIYTSLQRQIILNEFEDFNLNRYASNFRNHELLEEYFKNFKIPPSKLSIFSYLQHYGAPSPFIDFSKNLEKALYFAISNFKDSVSEIDKDLKNYFSLYFIEESDLELINICRVIESLGEMMNISEEVLQEYEDYHKHILIEHTDRILDIQTLEVYLIDNPPDMEHIYKSYNNIRIIAQEGLFVCNLNNKKPLEVMLTEFFKESTRFQHSPWDEIGTEQAQMINERYKKDLKKNGIYQSRLEGNIITDYQIHKSLVEEIRKSINLEESDIYPNPENLAWKIFEQTAAK